MNNCGIRLNGDIFKLIYRKAILIFYIYLSKLNLEGVVFLDFLIEENEFELAMTVLNDSLSKLDFNRDLVYTRALVADRLGKIELVENDLRKILSLFPNDADALNALGYSLTNFTSRYEEAYQLIRRALELKSDSFYILDSMGWVYFKLGDLRRSIFYLEKYR